MSPSSEIDRRSIIRTIWLSLLGWFGLTRPVRAVPDQGPARPHHPTPTLTHLKIASARAVRSTGRFFDVEIRIDDGEGRRLRDFTSRFVGRVAEFRFGGKIIIASVINEPISGPVFWIGLYGAETEARQLATALSGQEIDVTIEP